MYIYQCSNIVIMYVGTLGWFLDTVMELCVSITEFVNDCNITGWTCSFCTSTPEHVKGCVVEVVTFNVQR